MSTIWEEKQCLSHIESEEIQVSLPLNTNWQIPMLLIDRNWILIFGTILVHVFLCGVYWFDSEKHPKLVFNYLANVLFAAIETTIEIVPKGFLWQCLI